MFLACLIGAIDGWSSLAVLDRELSADIARMLQRYKHLVGSLRNGTCSGVLLDLVWRQWWRLLGKGGR